MPTPQERAELVSELATRPGHEKVRALLHRLLVDGLGADSRDIDFEKPVPEVHGRIDALLFDRILNNMIHFGERAEPPANFAAWMDRERVASPADKLVLRETYGVMRRLQGEGRNHIWGYVARNLARPVWLASEAQKADVVIGNPPWVAYRYMSGAFKKRFRNECQAVGLWVGGKVAAQQDLAGYFHVRAAALYLRQTGRMALVMPYAALSRQA